MENIIGIMLKKKNISSNIIFSNSAADDLLGIISSRHANKKICVITDENLLSLYKDSFLKKLEEIGAKIIALKPGETSKTRKEKEKIEDMLLADKFGRDSLIISFGGGVISDIAGFAASTYNRGIPVINIPTSLLAIADASIGGKNGIDTKHGKNLIGTIHHPDAVIIFLGFLDSLPEDEFKNGLAEIVKISVILDKEMFDFIKANMESILARDANALDWILKRSIGLKKNIVEKDPDEKGLRQILNFGHTVGHAIESYGSFRLKHGFCVSIGMAAETEISVLNGNLTSAAREEILSVLKGLGLPVSLEKKASLKKLMDKMKHDKKSVSSVPRFVIIDRIGKARHHLGQFSFEADEKTIKKALKVIRND